MVIRRLLVTLCCAGLLAVGLTIIASAQQMPSASVGQSVVGEVSQALDETPSLWFVELSSRPAVEGTNLATLKAEKVAFRNAASKAGIRFNERFAFDRLWNGISIKVDRSQVGRLNQIDGVKAIYPVITIDAPEPATPDPTTDLYTALAMTGADKVQSSLGFTGHGVKVGIIDTGIDYDHKDLGGNGTPGSNSFPTERVTTGWDFVGDAFGSTSSTPMEDANPDDCDGHGTHVAGIVGANGLQFKGVAPGVTFGAYRVFGCKGSTYSDIMIKAMERALADGMDVVNMSIGSAYQWPEYPTAAAATRLVNKGVVVVASIGNDGEKGLAAAGAPGVGSKVIGVASFDNTHYRLPYFTVGGRLFVYNTATAAPAPPSTGTAALARTGTQNSTNDACGVPTVGSLSGKVALIRRGTCGFYNKALYAQQAGALGVVLYNNATGRVSPTVAGAITITIPVVAVTAADGEFLDDQFDSNSPVTMTWTALQESFVSGTGGLISSYSSYGLAADLSLKPDIGAPGGGITSTYPIEGGGYAVMSGTSMSSPHVAGTAALYLEAHPHTPAQAMRSILQNTATPKNWSGNPTLGYLDVVSRQGAGMVQIDKAIEAPVTIEPGKLSLGESQAGPQARKLSLENHGNTTMTFEPSFVNALSVRNLTTITTYANVGSFYNQLASTSNATVAFSEPLVTVSAGGTATVTATITAPTGPDKAHYGGYVVFTPVGGGTVLRVPYAGFVGDYQSIQVLTGTTNGFPWLSRLVGSSYWHEVSGASFSLASGDLPYFLVHFDYQSRLVRMEVFDAASGRAWHRALNQEFMGRNSATGFYAISWDGTTVAGRKVYTVPNGSYVMKLSVLKALGDENNPADWETWTSPAFNIAR